MVFKVKKSLKLKSYQHFSKKNQNQKKRKAKQKKGLGPAILANRTKGFSNTSIVTQFW